MTDSNLSTTLRALCSYLALGETHWEDTETGETWPEKPDTSEAVYRPYPVGEDGHEVEETDETTYGYGQGYSVDGAEYVVLTDTERDRAIHNAVESYIDDCALPEIPEHLRSYFDYEKFRRDVDFAGEGDGMISPYDGACHEGQIDGEWFYIVRVS